MEFKRPFDSEQRATAARLYRQYRRHLKDLHAKFSPRAEVERSLFRAYHDAVQDFGRALRKPDDQIDADDLNSKAGDAFEAAMNFLVERGEGNVYGLD